MGVFNVCWSVRFLTDNSIYSNMANYIMENGGCDLLKFGYNMVEKNGRLLKVISLSKCIQLYSNILSKKKK